MAVSGRIWKTSEDGAFVWMTMTPDRVPGALQVIKHGFLPRECVSIGLMLADNKQATDDVVQISNLVAQDGVSIVVIHVPTDQVVGVAFNKIQTKPKEGEKSFMDRLKSEFCNDAASTALMDVFIDVDGRVDAFEQYNATSLLELMFLAVLPEFTGKKLATGLTQCTEEMALALARGEVLVDNANSRNVSLVLAFFTSSISQRVGKRQQWDSLATVSHDHFSFQGKTFSERIGPQHPNLVLMAKKLNL